ncbi:MAG: DUF4384 domain-containing protein [Gemmatimonadetes bacterium]|nr:DUF4384 domain-containing protein [Gemmatimonadota bacterium]
MRSAILQIGLMVLAAGAVPAVAQEPQDAAPDTAMEARIWLDRGEDPVLQRGDRVRIYYWVNTDSYVALFHIDTDGSVTLLYPRSPGEDDFARAGRDYRLLFPSSSFWYVDEYPGKGYFFIVASSEPLDFDAYGYSSYDHAWDLSQVGQSVYTDPYVAMDDHVSHLIPDWQSVPYALDFATYDVGQAHEYPRFMCYQCHGYRSYSAWDPYAYGCSAVRVVIWNDPYYSPSYRYQGTRVVLARSRFGVPRYQFKKRVSGESWVPMIRTRQPPPRGVHYLEPGRAGPPSSAAPERYAVPRAGPARAVPRNTTPPAQQRRVFVPRTERAAPAAPAGRRTRPTTVVPAKPANPGQERPTLLRRPTSGVAPESPSRRGGGTGANVGPSRGREVVPPSRPTVTTRPAPPRPTVTPRPAPSRAPSRPVAKPRPKTGGGGGRPVARPSRTGGGGGRPRARPVRRGGGGGGGSARAPVRRRGGGGV